MSKTTQISAPVIQISGLSKTYAGSTKPALDNLSIEIGAGEVYGFLGPNGAGKSTTIRLLMNFLEPSKGSATIRDFDATKDGLEIRKSIGYLSGDFAIYPKMTGRQFLQYMAELQGGVDMSVITKLASKLDADLNKKLGELSRGNRQKIGIIQAFMHNPQILILDEPTSGLDPLVQESFYELLRDAKKRGASVFMSSHILSEVQKTCDRVGIIRAGKLISEDDIAEMTAEAAETFDVIFNEEAPIEELKSLKDASVKQVSNKEVTIHMHGRLSPLFAILAKHEVLKIEVHSLDLEESFMHFYEKKETK